MITIITEQPQNKYNQDKLVEIFRQLKLKNKDLQINLRVANSINSMRGYIPSDNECLIIFGGSLYKHVLKDINDFDAVTSNSSRNVHKFSYFIRNGNKHYFLACMPPIDFTMTKPETFLAFESFMKTLEHATETFKLDLRSVYLNKCKPARKNWKIDVIENGFSPRVKLHFKYDEIKSFLYTLFDLPNWTRVAIDTETTGLEIWNEKKHDIKIASFSIEENLGHAINLGLPGLLGGIKNGELKEVHELFAKYIFEKPKIFIAWNCGFDIFSICNKYHRSYKDFIRCNKIVDGMQLLHVLSENRKIEGYNLKACSRDFLNYAQYSYVEKYLHYLTNWQTYSIDQILEAANNSMKYAAEDAAGEFSLTTMIETELDKDGITKIHKDRISPKIMAIKLENESNGLTIDSANLALNSIELSGWEIDNLAKPMLKRIKDATDKKCRTDLFVFSATTGRLYYGKPFLNALKINTKIAKNIVAEPDHTLFYIDLDSADLRTAALTTQDYLLIDDLNEPGDFYRRFAHELFTREISDKEREVAKTFVLSMLNLAGDKTIAKETGVMVSDVKTFKEKFYSKYKKMAEYKINLESFLRRNNFVFSPSLRKRRFSEEDMSPDNFWRSMLSAHNFAFQATTSDLMLLNCFKFISLTREYGAKQHLINVDAAVFSCPTSEIANVDVQFPIFEDVPDVIWEGVTKVQEYIMESLPKTGFYIKSPKFKYKLYRGQNLGEMELVNA